MRGYAICATQRSGSTYLAQACASTGALGVPLDYFNPAGRRAGGWTAFPDGIDEQLALIVTSGATGNGVYGFKVFAEHLEGLERARWTERLPELHWVHLRRADVLGQAISLVLAKQTGRWRSTAPPLDSATYDAVAIEAEIAALARDDARWETFFASAGIRPLTLEYAFVAAHPQPAVDAIAALVGTAPARVDLRRVDVAVQRDAINAAWRARFVAERTALRP